MRRRPRLRLSADPPRDLGTQAKVVPSRQDKHNDAYWLRMAVTNDGMTTAHDVRVILLRIDAPEPWRTQPPSRELKWADVDADRATLPPKVSRLVDIVHIVRVTEHGRLNIRRHERCGLVPTLKPLSAADSGRPGTLLWRDLLRGTYVVHVALSADDVPSSHVAVRFRIDAHRDFDACESALAKATAGTV